MVGNKKVWAGILILALVVAGAGVAYAQWGGSDSGKKKDLIILSDVERRTLQDTVTLTGTLARQELRKVTAVAQGRVSGVYAKDGSSGARRPTAVRDRRTRRDRGAGLGAILPAPRRR